MWCASAEPRRGFQDTLRILLVLIEPPLPFGNAAARWYYVLLRGLVARGHDVTAFATCSNPHDIPMASTLFPSPQYDLRCFPVVSGTGILKKCQSFLRPMSYLFAEDFRRELATELDRGYDILHLEQLWSMWVRPSDSTRTVVNVHYLFDIDTFGAAPRSVRDRVLQRAILGAERRLVRLSPNLSAFSQRLSDRLGEMNPTSTRYVVPLGIDLTLYPFAAFRAHEPPTVGLIGSFSWGPTLAAGERLVCRLWPAVKKRVPTARLLLVGRQAREQLGRFAAEDVTIVADVPDALPYFSQLDVLVYAPPVGSGMKVKILEAFALGTPVVTNKEGVEGIPAHDDVHAAIAESDADLIDRVVALLTDEARRRRYRDEARALVELHCASPISLDRVERLYGSLRAGGSQTDRP